MSDDVIAPMTAAAQDVAAHLLRSAPPRPARTWAEFKEVFESVDRPAMERLRNALDATVPGVDWFGDEVPSSGEGWFVDVTDGAVQYLQGLPHWCVTLCLVRDGDPVATVIHSATRAQTYTAQTGLGASCNGEPLRPSTKTELGVCIAVTNQPPFITSQSAAITAAAHSLAAMLPLAGAVRNFGPTSWQIAETTAGLVDLFWEYGRDNENLLAASLVARESGLKVTDAAGNRWHPDANSFLAAPAHLHADIVTALASVETGPRAS